MSSCTNLSCLARVNPKDKVTFHKGEESNSLIKELLLQRTRQEFCDVVLAVRDVKIYCHRAVLAASSPYFRTMFLSFMLESTSSCVDLSDSMALVATSAFQQVIDYLYTGKLEITLNTVQDIVAIADFLLLDLVKEFCTQFFIQYGNLNLGNCINLYLLTERFHLKEVHEVTQKMIACRLHDALLLGDEIPELSETLLLQILSRSMFTRYLRSENLRSCLFRWARYDLKCRKSALPNICDKLGLQKEDSENDGFDTDCRTDSGVFDEELMIPKIHRPQEDSNAHDVLLCISVDINHYFMKLLLYSIESHLWYSVPIASDAILKTIPSRLNVGAITTSGQTLYLLLCHTLSYPTDMKQIQVLAISLSTGSHSLLIFESTVSNYQSVKTTINDNRSVPPVMMYCGGYLCIVGNLDGVGHLFLCQHSTMTYGSYHVPGTRFISLARACVTDDRFFYLWCRHRYGHEEYCINKEVSFSRFDTQLRCFNQTPLKSPFGVAYHQFSDPYQLEGGEFVYFITPQGKSVTYSDADDHWNYEEEFPMFEFDRSPKGTSYKGHVVSQMVNGKCYILQNPYAFITHLSMLEPGKFDYFTPPPIDGISLVTKASLPTYILATYLPASHFDESFSLLHGQHVCHSRSVRGVNDDDEESNPSLRSFSNSEEDYEYDGFEYDDFYNYYYQ